MKIDSCLSLWSTQMQRKNDQLSTILIDYPTTTLNCLKDHGITIKS